MLFDVLEGMESFKSACDTHAIVNTAGRSLHRR
jgi:hypothetical protein